MREPVDALISAGSSRTSVGGVSFTAWSALDAPSALRAIALTPGIGVHVHLANAYSVALADKEPDLRTTFNAVDAINLADGKPVSWFARFTSGPRLEQVRGPQLFLDTIDQSQGYNIRHYFVGGRPEVLSELISVLSEKFPKAQIVGHESPPFRAATALEASELDERIQASGANFVWVGLGTPKQDFEAQRIARALPVVAMAVGAAFDFAAGSLPEAPIWMRRLGFEWAFRLFSEPRRLWRRYTFGSARFIWVAATGVLRGSRLRPLSIDQ